MRIWAYEVIDWGAVRDDHLAAIGISPRTAYPTMDRAKEMAQSDWDERNADWDVEYDGSIEPPPLVWVEDETNSVNQIAEPHGIDFITYRVYYIDIKGVPVEDTDNG